MSDDSSNKDAFEAPQIRKSKWTSPEAHFASLDFFIKKIATTLKDSNNTKFPTFLQKSGRH